MSEIYYLIRSKSDGRHLAALPKDNSSSYLLIFRENYDAMSYLNAHAANLADRFAVESFPSTQLGGLLKRWGFSGVGVVEDPLVPTIDFLQHD
jgi:hypothetical protein